MLNSFSRRMWTSSLASQMTQNQISKPIQPFPKEFLLPKNATQALNFIKKYPTYDGRGVLIAILDTGVDPGAAGLQVTTDGKAKIVDIVDCSGAGDVDMSKKTVGALDPETQELTITGLSGRKLILNKQWKNPSNSFRVGLKNFRDLFPRLALLKRVESERKKTFELEHHKYVSEVAGSLSQLNGNSKLNEEDIKRKEDLEARQEMLNSMFEKFEEPGYTCDCVSWHDGEKWRAVIDIYESGNMKDIKPLADFAEERDYLTVSKDNAMYNISVKFYQNGDILSIVGTSGSHGTHVAAITAANHPNEPELNGIAPGAQIISLQIGDNRLDSLETSVALTRAVTCIAKWKCDLFNMSFGEPANISNCGRFPSLLRDELVNRYNCILVSSAGNAGPALSTVGAPGGTTEGVIGVGAYVTHSMMEAEYSLNGPVPERQYTWCSRGPSTDGDIGITIYAPGGAITSVPEYTLQGTQLMNGTSMSSPNCCGNLALILSGLKQQSVPYTPYRVDKAIRNTSKPLPNGGEESMNIGVLQTESAFEHLIKQKDQVDQDVFYQVTIPSRSISDAYPCRGIYLRDYDETNRMHSVKVSIQPKFVEPLESDSDQKKKDLSELKIQFESRLALIAQDEWVSCPSYLLVNNGGRVFSMDIDPTHLEPGKFHFTEVIAYDSHNPQKGPLFKVPISICKPLLCDKEAKVSLEKIQFFPGDVQRTFVSVPKGATWAELSIRSHPSPRAAYPSPQFMIHLIQLLPQKRYTTMENKFSITLPQHENENNGSSIGAGPIFQKKKFSVVGGKSLEVCLAQFWSSLGNNIVSAYITFHGIQTHVQSSFSNSREIFIQGGVNRIDLFSPIRLESLEPKLSLAKVRSTLRPSKFNISPKCPSRDCLPNTKQVHQLILSYRFSHKEDGKLTIQPHLQAFENLIYESAFDGMLLLVMNGNNQLLAIQDPHTKPITITSQGDYTLRLQICHTDVKLLQQLSDFILFLDRELPKEKEIIIPLHNTFIDAVNGYKTPGSLKAFSIGFGEQKPIFTSVPKEFAKGTSYGDVFLGELNFKKTKHSGSWLNVIYTVPPASSEPSSVATTENKDEDEELKYTETIRDTRISAMIKVKDQTTQDKLIATLLQDYPTHVPLLAKILVIKAERDSTTTDELLELSNKIISNIDEKDLAMYFGVNRENTTEKSKKLQKAYKKSRKMLSLAYQHRCLLMSKKDSITSDPSVKLQLEQVWETYRQWVHTIGNCEKTDFGYLLCYVSKEKVYGRYGNALKAVHQFLESVGGGGFTSPEDNEEGFRQVKCSEVKKAWLLKCELLRTLNWAAWENYEQRWKYLKFPEMEPRF